MAACADNLLCAPLKDQKLAGTGVGFCNLTKGGDVSFIPLCKPMSLRPWQVDAFHRHGTERDACEGDGSMLVGAVSEEPQYVIRR